MNSDEKTARREAAIERQKIYDNLSIEEKISLAENRRGESKKELKRLKVKK